MTINLANYSNLETSLFVRIDVEQYRESATDVPQNKILTFSDSAVPITIDGQLYVPLGNLLQVGNNSSELRIAPGNMTVIVSGIPNTSIGAIIHSQLKGSAIKIYRVFFDPVTKQMLNITGNPMGRFQGVINNYNLQEEYSTSNATNSIVLTCSSIIEILSKKISGRRTNPLDQRKLYPSDPSMDRVPNLANSNFNFGAVVK
jgi:hypothetical protein